MAVAASETLLAKLAMEGFLVSRRSCRPFGFHATVPCPSPAAELIYRLCALLMPLSDVPGEVE